MGFSIARYTMLLLILIAINFSTAASQQRLFTFYKVCCKEIILPWLWCTKSLILAYSRRGHRTFRRPNDHNDGQSVTKYSGCRMEYCRSRYTYTNTHAFAVYYNSLNKKIRFFLLLFVYHSHTHAFGFIEYLHREVCAPRSPHKRMQRWHSASVPKVNGMNLSAYLIYQFNPSYTKECKARKVSFAWVK